MQPMPLAAGGSFSSGTGCCLVLLCPFAEEFSVGTLVFGCGLGDVFFPAVDGSGVDAELLCCFRLAVSGCAADSAAFLGRGEVHRVFWGTG